jgi:hypothetical protein
MDPETMDRALESLSLLTGKGMKRMGWPVPKKCDGSARPG